MHNSRYTVYTHLIDVRQVLVLPKKLSRLELATVPMYRVNDRSTSPYSLSLAEAEDIFGGASWEYGHSFLNSKLWGRGGPG